MSDSAKSTEEIVEIVVNKKSWSEARDFVKQLIAEVPENKPKTRRKYEVILEKLGEIRTLINDKVAKIKSANEQIAERDSIIASLEAAAENEPIANTFGLVRHASYFTDTVARLEAGEEPIADEYHCYSPIQHVASRLKPIVAGSDGVIGIKAFASENFGHVIMFSDVVGLIEVRERTKLDPHNNPNDGAAVYVEAVTLAVEIADVYAEHFGAFDAIAATARHNTENSAIPTGAVIAEDLEVDLEVDLESEEGDEDSEGEGEGEEDGIDDEDENEGEGGEAGSLEGEEDEDADDLDEEG